MQVKQTTQQLREKQYHVHVRTDRTILLILLLLLFALLFFYTRQNSQFVIVRQIVNTCFV